MSDDHRSFYNALDIMAFAIGLANYQENVGQSQLQEVVAGALSEVHSHLEAQDEKLKKIMEAMNIDS